MFPQHVAERLKDGEAVAAEAHESVTILFADIVNFTSMSSTASPPHPVVVGCLAKLAKGKELDAVGRQFEPIPPLRFHDGGALVVWPGMLFPNSRGF